MSAALDYASQTNMAELIIKPLQPEIGAEIGGVDLTQPISDATRDAIKNTILKYKVVFFRDQHLNRDQHADLPGGLGSFIRTRTAGGMKKIAPIHKIDAADNARFVNTPDPTTIESGYHTDTSWRLVPTWGAVLRAVNLPEVGGDTIWVDAGAAYDLLPGEVKQRLEGRHVTHDYREALNNHGLDYRLSPIRLLKPIGKPGVKSWVNFTEKPHIIGLDAAENKELLRIVLDHYKNRKSKFGFPGNRVPSLFWDNRATVHLAVRNYGDFPRLLDRILLKDEPQYAEL